jgi:hypothetical protein
MRRIPHHSRIDRTGRWLLVVVALVVGQGWQAQASTIPAVSYHAAEPAKGHSHRCKCGMDCGSSCCCDPDKNASKPAAEPEPETMPKSGSAPCLNSAPCHDSGLPSSPTAGPFGKVAALDLGGLLRVDSPERLVAADLVCILPARTPSRIDDPPERPDAA